MKLINLCRPDSVSYGIGASGTTYQPGFPAYLRITDISDSGSLIKPLGAYINPSVYPDWGRYVLKKNDIVFARTGNSTGRNYFHNSEDILVFAGFLIKFSLDPSKVVPRYVGYYCQSQAYRNQIKSFFEGSTRPTMNAELYKRLEIPIVSRDFQQHIVGVRSEYAID